MAAEFLDPRNRRLGLAAAVAVHGLLLGALVLFGGRQGSRPAPPAPGMVAINLDMPPPAPPPAPPPTRPPDDVEEGSALPSRGDTDAPAVSEPPAPLPLP